MRVLVLEDNPLVARGLLRLLRLLGHESEAAKDCASGYSAMQSGAPVHAVIVDLGLDNGESGLSFLNWVKLHRPEVQRVLTTGAAFRPKGFEERPPMDYFLPKPFGMDDLQRILSLNPACGSD